MSFSLRLHRASMVLVYLIPVILLLADRSKVSAQDAAANSVSLKTDSQNEDKEDGWIIRSDDTGTSRTRYLTLHPKLEPVPALKYRFIPDDFDRIDGNAALYYLKAMGFLEQSRAKELITSFLQENAKRANAEGQDDYPPYTWMKMAPNDLPISELKTFLRLVSFQEPLLRAASYRTDYSLDRNFKNIDNPVDYLLPEINQMRQLARYNSLRFRLALAEDRVDDAIEYLGQTLAIAEHLGHDEIFVSNLVGIAIAGVAWDDALYLSEHPDAPNLYWAYAALPKPLVKTRRSLAYERQLLFEQIKLLRQVDRQLKNAGFWRDFVDRLIATSDSLAVVLGSNWDLRGLDESDARAAIATAIAVSFPSAKQYLLQDAQLDSQTVDAYTKAQTVFLALKIYSERARDEQLKWQFVPYPLAESSSLKVENHQQIRRDEARIGWITKPAHALIPAAQAVADIRHTE